MALTESVEYDKIEVVGEFAVVCVRKKNIIKIPIGTILNVFGTQSRFDHTTENIDFS